MLVYCLTNDKMQSHWTAFSSKKQALPVVGVRGFEPPEALKKTWSPLRVVKSPLDAPCFFPASTRCIRRPSALVFAALAPELIRDNKNRSFIPLLAIMKKARTNVLTFFMVGVRGFEPPASWSRTKHSTKLSHTPKTILLVEYIILSSVCQA